MVGAAVLISGLGITVPAYSQHGDHGDRQGRHENQAEHEKAGREDKHSGKPEHARERVVEQHGPQRVEHAQSVRYAHSGPEQRVVWQEHRSSEWAHEHRDWQQRGGYHGYRIPHDRYVVYFGREHRFRVNTLPVVVVAGHPRFHFHDCWFTLVDPLPGYWSASWYQTDEVYVEYVHDGYYMYNTRHPGVAIAVSVSL
jgi:hypothetical protein